MDPRVLYLILCDDVHEDSTNFHRINIYGLVSFIRPKPESNFPLLHSQLTILLVLTECGGDHTLHFRVVQDATDRVVARNEERTLHFAGEANAVIPIVVRMKDCPFAAPGLYWLEAVINGRILARTSVIVLST